jgi:CubicO group peptidase (beta-lactamase class C family)
MFCLGASDSTVFPGAVWETATPKSQGIDPEKLREAIAFLEAQAPHDGVEELVMVRNGRIIHQGPKADRKHGIWSGTKSFTSTVLGLLIDDGKCQLNTLAQNHSPAMSADYPKVTLRHFATMTSGYRAVGDEPRGGYLHGPSRTPFEPNAEPLFSPPGSRYAYWDSAMNQFANVLTRIAGEPIEALFKHRVADPIGMRVEGWEWGDFGRVDGLVVNGGSGNNNNHLKISAQEMARFGLLFLNRGNWNGEHLISSAWVDAATRLQVPATVPLGHPESGIAGPGTYGFNWWVNGRKPDGALKWPGVPIDAYAASGHNNNDMFVLPSWNMVVVRLGLDQSGENGFAISDAVYATFLRMVGQAIQDTQRSSPIHPSINGPLRVHPENPCYFTDDNGRAVLLTGSHTWLNLQDGGSSFPPSPFDYTEYLDLLEEQNHNFIRLWNWEGPAWVLPDSKKVWLDPLPFLRTGPGKATDGMATFYLTQFNPAYFDRLRERVMAARDRGIYVGIMLFQGFSVSRKSQNRKETPWAYHPMNRANNVNHIDGDIDGDGEGYEVHELEIPEVTRIQEAFVRKVVDTVNDLDNVIYEISNECHGESTEWHNHMIDLIQDYEQDKPLQHLVWMSFQWDGLKGPGTNRNLLQSPAEIISPGKRGQRGNYAEDPPVADGTKIVIVDSDHVNATDLERVDWAWKCFTRGLHPIFMDDPPVQGAVGHPRFTNIEAAARTRATLGQILHFARRIDLSAMRPTDDPDECSTRYCLRNPGVEYLIFQPADDIIEVKIPPGTYRYEWFSPVTGETIDMGRRVVSEERSRFAPPGDPSIVLHLHSV